MSARPRQDDIVLRPSETLQCILDVELADSTTPRRCSIGVVAHRDNTQDTQVGSLFVFDAPTASVVPAVLHVLPITEHLILEVAQTGQVDSSTQTSSQSAWLLTIRRNIQDTKPVVFLVRTRDTPKLQTLTAECRRLKQIATVTHPSSTDFAWVEAYVSFSSSRRLDLRLRKQPLHTRLSPALAGFPGDDHSDISIVRHDWVERAAAKEASTGDVKNLKIRLGSFNVNGRSPSQDLHPWLSSSELHGQPKAGWISPLQLSPFKVSSDLHQEPRENNLLSGVADSRTIGDPDVLVLGFQELDLSTEALLYASSTLKEDEWLTAILAGLGEKRVLYEKLTSRQLVGMLLIVIVKKVLVPCFTDIRCCDAGSGIMGFMGNKGATAIRLEYTPQITADSRSTVYRSTILTFVNAHLAASDEMVDRRNYDFQELSGRLAFPSNDLVGSHLSFTGDTHNVYKSDVLFWMVHLNYRLDISDGDIRKLLFSHVSGINDIQTLLSYDQLRDAMQSNRAFSGFTEHPITHFPTYRLALGAAVSKDRLGYDKKRKPAWTDRILYMAPPDVSVAQVSYRSYPEITMSDHQPISADFNISLALVDRSRYENGMLALHRELVGFERSGLRPKIRIRPMSIDFGSIRYKQTIRREVVLVNEGDIPCVFRFVGAGADPEPVSPPWLCIEPMVGLLRARETTTILLSVYVDNDSAAKLNLGPTTLECTLILHTALGKDDFIAASGNYQYTCFANTLERLTRLAGPIRKLESPEDTTPASQATSAPTEIMRLINWMMTHIATTDALFERPAEERLCHVIRECLDTGDEFPSEGPDGDHGALVVAFNSTLVAFLDSLIEPVVPARLHAQCLQARNKDDAFEVLSSFPHESINVWVSLTAFLHYVALHGASMNDSSAAHPTRTHQLAGIFAPVLLRDDPTGVYPRASPVGKRDFLLHFID